MESFGAPPPLGRSWSLGRAWHGDKQQNAVRSDEVSASDEQNHTSPRRHPRCESNCSAGTVPEPPRHGPRLQTPKVFVRFPGPIRQTQRKFQNGCATLPCSEAAPSNRHRWDPDAATKHCAVVRRFDGLLAPASAQHSLQISCAGPRHPLLVRRCLFRNCTQQPAAWSSDWMRASRRQISSLSSPLPFLPSPL